MPKIRDISVLCPAIAPERLAALVTRAVVAPKRDSDSASHDVPYASGDWLTWADGNALPPPHKRVD